MCCPRRSSIADSIAVTAWIVVRRSKVCWPRPPASRSAKRLCTSRRMCRWLPSEAPRTSERASSSVARIFSPPGTSPMPCRPALSRRTTRLRVKNGACAPERLRSMLSRPATGITRISLIAGKLMTSIDLDPGFLHDPRPLHGVVLQRGGELVRGAADDVGALLREALAHIRGCQGLGERSIELGRDVFRRTGGREERDPEVGVVARDRVADWRNFRRHRGALERADA